MGNIFWVSHIFQNMRNPKNTCQYCSQQRATIYFIAEYSFKSNMSRVFLLIYSLNQAYLIQCNIKLVQRSRSKNLTYIYVKTFDNFIFPYFKSIILYSIHWLCIQWFFEIDIFWSVLYSFDCLLFPNVRFPLKICSYLIT